MDSEDSFSTVESEVSNPVLLIFLQLTYQLSRKLIIVSEDGTETLEWQNDGVQLPISDHTLPVKIFEDENSDSLSQFLSETLRSIHEGIEIESVATKLKNQWVLMRDEAADVRGCNGVFVMGLNLVFWDVERRFGSLGGSVSVDGDDWVMVKASERAVGEMLESVEIGEIVDERCVICLEKFKKKMGVYALRMPCLHVFHRDCVLNWLKNSHCCPICRFQLPTH